MEKRLRKLEWSKERKPRVRNEEEIYSISYDDTSDLRPISDISSFIKIPHRVSSSKQNVELSLEVEIADSLKRLIASPHQNDSGLLDVTIVRPTDLDNVRGAYEATNTLAFKNSEVRNLIATMEREKQHKKKLIEECKRKAACPKMNCINETREIKSNNSSDEFIFSIQDEHKSSALKRKLKKIENKHTRNNIAVMSAPTEQSAHKDIMDNIRKFTNNHKVAQNYTNSTHMTILKPIDGDTKRSLKHVVSYSKVGDHESMENKPKSKEHLPFSSTSDSNISSNFLHYRPEKREVNKEDPTLTPQIYATANTYDQLRNLLKCQNSQRRDQENEKPCMCQHCGMIGLLVESQKRPVVTAAPIRNSDAVRSKYGNSANKRNENEFLHKACRETTDSRVNATDLKSKCGGDHYWTIQDLSSRLEALEVRVAAQEHLAVPKDYFKRIINRIWHRQNTSSQQLRVNNLERSIHLMDRSTQYNSISFENVQKNNKVIKQRNVQIQQNTRKTYCVNPVLLKQTDSEQPSQSNESQEEHATESIKKTKPISIIGEFFTKKSDPNKSETGISNEKNSAIEIFWRWGEEIIKPGFDLKTKILSLLDQHFLSAKASKTVQLNVGLAKNKSQPKKTEVPKTTSIKNVLDTPVHLEDNKVEQHKNDKKLIGEASSAQALKKMLDLMSEKIYNDHVKPTVDAIKQEQKTNNENTKQTYNIKAAMDAAVCKVNSKEIALSKDDSLPILARKEWRKDFLEPLELPASIKGNNRDSNETSKPSKKSGIPVRVANTLPTDSVVPGSAKYREIKQSLIPRLKLPDNTSFTKVKHRKKIEKNQKIEKYEKKIAFKKLETRHHRASNVTKYSKPVQIKYMNPKAESWNEESCASVFEESSEEPLLREDSTRSSIKCEKARYSNKEEKRRIPDKHSVTDKVEFLTNITKTEMGKAHIWNNILKEAKNHCRSKQDTVVIQVPTKTYDKSSGVGLTEVEFTIEDIQKLVNNSKLASSIDVIPQNSSCKSDIESFLLIKSRKILQEVHRRLENKIFKR